MSEPKIKVNYRVVSGYMRDYKTASAAKAAFLAGYDFYLMPDRVPCSIRDFEPGRIVCVRYKREYFVVNVEVPANPVNIAIGMSHGKYMASQFPRGWQYPAPKVIKD